eukprot:TRINITY_DN25885_c0_g1_i1.p2 TRINITY_DN25885_c0_g1~~TRINITY_DN25885_c0_g1_i1.p2  ORF type:complete len:117 (-),score=17.36 TRINITY_DN25885_c0_g1_i1:59-409(-)
MLTQVNKASSSGNNSSPPTRMDQVRAASIKTVNVASGETDSPSPLIHQTAGNKNGTQNNAINNNDAAMQYGIRIPYSTSESRVMTAMGVSRKALSRDVAQLVKAKTNDLYLSLIHI